MRSAAPFLFLALFSAAATAQQQAGRWVSLAYTYTDIIYKEPGAMSERGSLAGIRGELGLGLLENVALSAGGEYQDGHMNYDGATFSGVPVKQVTNDYFRDLRAMLHVVYSPVLLSIGVAERYWFNDLVISYRRRTQYTYNPLVISYFMPSGAYVRFEHDLWGKGRNTSHMHDVNPAAKDVHFTLGKGTGFGVEIGFLLPSPVLVTQLYLRYHHWDVKESDVQSDGTQNLIEPDNNTTMVQAGIGVVF